MFSVYSMLQHDLASFRHAYVRNLQRIALVALPASVVLAIAAEPIVAALLGEKWLPAVPALRVLAIYGLLVPFGGVSAEAVKGLGRPQWNVVFGMLYVVMVIPALLAAALAALLVPSQSMSPAASLILLVSVGLVVYVVASALFARSVVVPMWCSLRSGRE
jgi:PST family polysaccharide transporter/lipopolysaccharide exporter